MLIGATAEAVVRTGQIQSDGLQFSVTHVVYGSGGFDPLSPATPLPLDPANTALISEVFRKSVAPSNTIINDVYLPRGKETTYTSVGGAELTGVVGEAGLVATVTSPGTTGLAVGYQFLLVHAHFGRVIITTTDRLSLAFPIQYYTTPIVALSYDGSATYDDPSYAYSG